MGMRRPLKRRRALSLSWAARHVRERAVIFRVGSVSVELAGLNVRIHMDLWRLPAGEDGDVIANKARAEPRRRVAEEMWS